jgi:hypothetical protein
MAVAVLLLASISQAQEAPRPGAPLEEDPGRGASAGPPTPARPSVVLVTLDGVRWQEVFGGTDAEQARRARLPPEEVLTARQLMPNFHARFVDGGVVLGAPDRGPPPMTSPAAMSLPGYMEVLSGRREEFCASNRCPATRTPTLLDEVRRAPGGKYQDVAAISSWEVLERAATNDPTSFPMSYGRGYGITREKFGVDRESVDLLKRSRPKDPFPGYEDYRPDWITAALALRYLQAKHPRLFYVGLGDADEYGHRDDYRAYQRAIRQSDAFLGELFEVLDRRGEGATVIVTTDHGRGSQSFANHGPAYPESRRVWIGAAGGAIPRRGAVASPTERRLADIAPTIRVLLGLKADSHPQGGAVLTELLPEPPGSPPTGR